MATLSAAGSTAAQEAGDNVQPDWGDWFTDAASGGAVDNYVGTTADMRGQDQVTIEVGTQGNGGPFAFAPPAIWIDPGTTITFEWISDNHNVLIEEQPGGAGWEGHEPLENTGFSFEHTFETGGIYKYYCQPHLALGMKGGIAVGDDVPTAAIDTGGDGDGAAANGERPWVPPGGDLGLAFIVLVLGTAGAVAISVLAGELYRVVKRGASRAPEEREEETEELAPGAVEEAEPFRDVVREIGHDEFEPNGTAALIVIYFLILVLMWIFVYFVEFLGGGPTITG